MRFPKSSEQRTYCGGLQNPLASLEELRRRQSEVMEHPERLDERLAAVASKPGTYSSE
jgi:hypothetical protein